MNNKCTVSKTINNNKYNFEVLRTLMISLTARKILRLSPRDNTNSLQTLDSPRLSKHSKDVCCPPTCLPKFRPSPESQTVDRCRPLDRSSCNQKIKM